MAKATTDANTEVQRALPRLEPSDRQARIGRLRSRRPADIRGATWENVVRYLEIIEANTGRNGCRLAREVFAAKLGRTTDVLDRISKLAKSLQLAFGDAQYNDKGWQSENHWWINWDCLDFFGETNSVHEGSGECGETDIVHAFETQETGETNNVHGSGSDSDEAGAGAMDRAGPGHFAAPGGGISRPPEPQNAAPPFVMVQRPINKRRATINPICGASTNTIPPPSPIQPFEKSAQTNAAGAGRPCRLSEDLLRSPLGVEKWFRFALKRGWIEECDRLRVFMVAQSVIRRKVPRGKVKDPCGAFVRIIKRKMWAYCSLLDERDAKEAIAEVERAQDPRHQIERLKALRDEKRAAE